MYRNKKMVIWDEGKSKSLAFFLLIILKKIVRNFDNLTILTRVECVLISIIGIRIFVRACVWYLFSCHFIFRVFRFQLNLRSFNLFILRHSKLFAICDLSFFVY